MGYTFSTRRLIQPFEDPVSLPFHHPKKKYKRNPLGQAPKPYAYFHTEME
jgi:hypothetical protein